MYDRAVVAARSSPERFLQLRVARVALAAAAEFGFALGGGHALRLHGLVRRPTAGVHLATDRESAVRPAVAGVRAALAAEGLAAAPPDEELFEGSGDAYAELTVRDARDAARLSLARLPRQHAAVPLSVGPVLHPDDLFAAKVVALATRSEIRDYLDVGAALAAGYDRGRLLTLARLHDPGLTDDELAAALRRLDALPDTPFLRYGVRSPDVGELRRRLSDWPR
ncbi:hypothetical protein Sya03_30710 [Spirilliplanes yamanashiensis]|uniref:Nucleotidyl transferase AbiEii/AbiGii toxin family protein n=1 Tax=Spirilliplanes yamanashiensis TaxID=42233 RepID=A0A8J4DJV9_9ACTN|nr:hypothetical protein Sya03_30710 [Spirilliplanes yamanashiensis]